MNELMELAAGLMGDRGLAQTMEDTFAKMVDAERLIYKRMAGVDDATRRRYWNAFMDLVPPAVFAGMDNRLYESHVDEILGRVRDDGDVVPLTEAEQLAHLSKASLEHPPDRYTYAYFSYLFLRIYADDPRAEKILGDLDPESRYYFRNEHSDADSFPVVRGREMMGRLKSGRTNKRPPPRDVPENVLAALERGDPEW